MNKLTLAMMYVEDRDWTDDVCHEAAAMYSDNIHEYFYILEMLEDTFL